MRPFRATYGIDETDAFSDYLRVAVIGHHNRFTTIIDGSGMCDYFIALFHDPVFVGTPAQPRQTSANTMVIYPPGVRIYHGRSSPWRRSWVRCSGTMITQLIDGLGLPTLAPLVLGDDVSATESILAIHREIRHPYGADLRNIEDLFRLWLRNVQRAAMGSAAPPIPESFQRARQFIESNFLERFTLDDVAKYCFISKPHLSNGFPKHFGRPPLAYAIHLRLEHAKDLLRETALSITQIAGQSGFEDVYYFSKLFKQKTGMRASDYRRANR